MKEPNVHVIEAAKILKVDRGIIPELMKKHGIPVTASFPHGRGKAYFYDRAQAEALAQQLKSPAPAPEPQHNTIGAEILSRLAKLEALLQHQGELLTALQQPAQAEQTPAQRRAALRVANGHASAARS